MSNRLRAYWYLQADLHDPSVPWRERLGVRCLASQPSVIACGKGRERAKANMDIAQQILRSRTVKAWGP